MVKVYFDTRLNKERNEGVKQKENSKIPWKTDFKRETIQQERNFERISRLSETAPIRSPISPFLYDFIEDEDEKADFSKFLLL